MNISYRWLKSIAPGLEGEPRDLAERLALLGSPVESITDLGAALGDVVVARVVEAGPHPNADRLTLCRVDAGGPETLSVVCGAPNVRAGAYYAFAPAGSTLPGGLKLKRAKIRGEVSEGMLCSPSELGLGTDHSGILEMEAQPVGTSFVRSVGLDDACLDVEVTANRGDLLSHRGVARELVGEAGLVRPPIPGGAPPGITYAQGERCVEASGVAICISEVAHCWRFLGAVIRDVKVGPSPDWLQTRLRAVGARPINNVVDATNYVMLELGQPMHAYDLARIRGGRIDVRGARPAERLRTLDGVERQLEEGMLLICDGEGPVGIAGVMGGEDSEVSERTRDVLLECALFEPGQVRRTRRALDLSTDASYRYERGVDPRSRVAFERALEILLATAGGRIEGPALDVCPTPWVAPRVDLRVERASGVLGVDLGAQGLVDLLTPLGFEVEPGSPLRVQVPGHRAYDVLREIDLIEEVARRHGYDRFPSTLAPFRPSSVPDHPLFALEESLRAFLVGEGLFEIHTMALTGQGEVPVSKPLSSEGTHLRADLLPGMLGVLTHNFHRSQRDLRFFEIGTVFHAVGPGERPRESTRLAVALTGARHPAHWTGAAGDFDAWDLKGLLGRTLTRLGGEAELRSAPADLGAAGALAPLWSAWGPSGPLGLAGRVASAALDAPPWAGPVWAFEVELPAEGLGARVEAVRSVPSQPAVERDFSLLMARDLAVGSVETLIRERAGSRLTSLTIFDAYEGKGVPQGRRSVSFRLRFQAEDRTLTDAEVDKSTRKVLQALKEELDVEPRA